MSSRSGLERKIWVFALGQLALAYACAFFYRHLADADEGRYAEIPREMLARGDLMVMTLLGYPYYEKPPLTYWLVAGSLDIFGMWDWSARIPLFLGLVLLSWFVWRSLPPAWSAGDRRITLFVSATMLSFFVGITYLATDALLLVFFSATCLSLFLGFGSESGRGRAAFVWSAGLCASLGVLTKGFLALVLPAAIAMIWLLVERRYKDVLSLRLWGPVLLCLGTSVPVLLLVEQHNPGFMRQFIFEEHVARFLGSRANQGHEEPFWFFLPMLPFLLLPWSFFIPRWIRRVRSERLWQGDSFYRFLVIWAGLVLLFFSASTGKLVSYVLPAMLPLGILIGKWGVAGPAVDPRDRVLLRWGWAGPGLFALLLVAGWCIAYFQWMPERMPSIEPWICLVLSLPLLVAIWGVRVRGGDEQGVLSAVVASLLLCLALILSPLGGKDFVTNGAPILYKHLAAELREEDRVIVAWEYAPSLAFYTRRVYRPFQYQGELDYGMKQAPELPREIETVEELVSMAREGPGRLFVVVHSEEAERFAELPLVSVPLDIQCTSAGRVLEILGPK